MTSVAKELDGFISNFEVSGDQVDFLRSLVNGAVLACPEIDGKIESLSSNWKLNRMGFIDRAILRLAGYELLKTDTPHAVVINEAVELAKEFGDIDSPNFVNGILDNLRKTP